MDPASAHLTRFPVENRLPQTRGDALSPTPWRGATPKQKIRRNNTPIRHRHAGLSDVFVTLMDPASMHLDAPLIAVTRVSVNYI
jgi:hypothetical protein